MSVLDTSTTIITLDGPAASGKSSAARRVADHLGLPFVSSGLLYRAATYLVLESDISATDEVAVMNLLKNHQVELIALPVEANRVEIDAKDVSAALHTDDVDAAVSTIAKHPQVRRWVFERLRETKGSFVVEGRDMGTVVFPQADHKIYLSAPAEVRAARRVNERSADLQAVTEAIKARDLDDAEQLEPAKDAKHLDTATLNLDEVVKAVLRLIEAKQA